MKLDIYAYQSLKLCTKGQPQRVLRRKIILCILYTNETSVPGSIPPYGIWNTQHDQFRLKWTHSGNSQLRSKSVQQFWSNHIWCPASCQVRDRWGRIKLKHTYEQSPFSFKRGYTRSCSGLCTTYENSSEVARGLEVGDILLFREEIRGYTQGPRDPGTQEHTTPEGTGMIMTIQQPRYWEKIWRKKNSTPYSPYI